MGENRRTLSALIARKYQLDCAPQQILEVKRLHALDLYGVNMPPLLPSNAEEVGKVIEARLAALDQDKGQQETVTIEWRGALRNIPVISMPVDLLSYNPRTHRIRAQLSLQPDLEKALSKDPFGLPAQGYLHTLLMGDPTEPAKVDPSFVALKEDVKKHGQNEPGIVTRSGVLINGNTRRAALKESGSPNIRVGVLPADASIEDLESIELSLQLRKDHRRDYSFMNFLLAIDERVTAGQLPTKIQSDFRIKATTYECNVWILALVREAINRSEVAVGGGKSQMRLVDFERDQGKLEELYRAYSALKAKAPDDADALREQRLLALVLGGSKTDLRFVDPDFAPKFMKDRIPPTEASPTVTIPGTRIAAAGPSAVVVALRKLTTTALQSNAIRIAASAADSKVDAKVASSASETLGDLKESFVKALELAGKQARLQKKRYAATDRISDACDDLELALAAVSEARATGNFDAEDLDDILVRFQSNLRKLSSIVTRDSESLLEGVQWLRSIAAAS